MFNRSSGNPLRIFTKLGNFTENIKYRKGIKKVDNYIRNFVNPENLYLSDPAKYQEEYEAFSIELDKRREEYRVFTIVERIIAQKRVSVDDGYHSYGILC